MLEEYAVSGLGRREFCEQRQIPLTTFDYWRRDLEKGRFGWPEAEGARSVTMRAQELMPVNGLDWKQTRHRNWYRKSA